MAILEAAEADEDVDDAHKAAIAAALGSMPVDLVWVAQRPSADIKHDRIRRLLAPSRPRQGSGRKHSSKRPATMNVRGLETQNWTPSAKKCVKLRSACA